MNSDNEHTETETRAAVAGRLNSMVRLPMPDGMTRPETGAMQFGNDWPGVFIRGDNAAHYAMMIDTLLLQEKTDPIAIANLSALGMLLKGSKASNCYRPVTDDEIVTHGDVVHDLSNPKFEEIIEEGIYDDLLGLCGEQARLHEKCHEVYTKRPAPPERHTRWVAI